MKAYSVGVSTKMIMMILTLGVSGGAPSAAPAGRDGLGRKEKLRILVDKVMQPVEGWVTKEWIVRETARAGFNVFSPRRGHDRLDEVERVTGWCRKYGIFHMPWMRGTLQAPETPASEGKRILWASGSEQPLWSVCSDEFWEWTRRYIVEYARMSAEKEHLIGVFLDYENYWPGGQGNLYTSTYENAILEPFAKSKGIRLPELPPGGRKSWLEDRGLHEEFTRFQVEEWRRRCRVLREEVDRQNPKFRFCVYPAPGTRFIVDACYPEWSTATAPLILADARVYGRPSRFLSQGDALEGNRRKLLDGMKIPRGAGIPFIYAGGIDPVVRGADPEFSGKNAVMISEVADGYWVFYEGPAYDGDHPEYFRWFAWANERIKRGELQAWREPRTTPEEWMLELFKKVPGGFRASPPEGTGRKIAFVRVTLRHDNLMVLAVKKGQPVEVTLRNVPVGRYISTLVWDVRRQDLTRVASGTIPHGGEGTITLTPEDDGLYLLGASAGSCAYSVVSANIPVGLYAGDGLRLIHSAERLYFWVPQRVSRFRITAEGSGSETVRVKVLDPGGKTAAAGQTTPSRARVEVRVAVEGRGGKAWSLVTARADEGVLEDHALMMSAELPQVFSLAPEQVFGATRTR